MRTLIPIISIVIAITIFFAFVRPLFSDVRIIQDEIVRIEEQLSKKTDLTEEVQSLLAVKKSHSATNIERLEAMIPDTIDEVKIIADLSALAEAHNMLFGNIFVESENDGDSQTNASREFNGVALVSSDITFGLVGNYDQFKLMLADIERSLVLLDVLQITFSAGEGDLVQYSLKVRTYAMPEVTS